MLARNHLAARRFAGPPPRSRETPSRVAALAALAAALALPDMGCGRGGSPRVPGRTNEGLAEGYVLFAPLLSTTTYLVDRRGQVVHMWNSDLPPGASVYLLANGHLLRCSRQPGVPVFHGGGLGGRLQEFDWEGNLVWDWVIASGERVQHHDVAPLPDGDVLLIAWEARSREQAIRAGRAPDRVGPAGLWPDCILEVRPEPPRGGSVVWEWHLWDHLVQDRDAGRENFGRLSEHPGRVDINGERAFESVSESLIRRLQALGYAGGGITAADLDADFVHTNSIAYNARLDQIAICAFHYDEIWIIDHGTTSREAAGHAGGRSGKGGDLLYRWGNPRAYGRGRARDRRLFGAHDARWIPEGYPGAGHLMVFNNGSGRDGLWSSVLEIEPPLDRDSSYRTQPEAAFGPPSPAWEYTAPNRRSFYADFISGAHRLPDGNTFITNGPRGRFFEVAPDKRTVWEYANPYSGDAPNPEGDPPFSVFRATFLPADHPGLAGRRLAPLRPQPPTLPRSHPD